MCRIEEIAVILSWVTRKLEKTKCQGKALKTVGRPTDSDYVSIMKWILEKSTDRNFAENLEIDSVAYEDTKELPRKVIVKVNTGVDATKKYYTFEPRTKNISEMNEKEWKELSEGIESIAK